MVERDGALIGKAGLWRLGEIRAPARARHPGPAALTAEIAPRDIASAALLGRLGFAETHRAARAIEVAGEWCDSGDWRLARPAAG